MNKSTIIAAVASAIAGIGAVSPVVAQIVGKALSEKSVRTRTEACLTSDYQRTLGDKSLVRESAGSAAIATPGDFGSLVNASGPMRANTKTDEGYLPPYHSEFDTTGLDGWTLLDINEDGQTWVVASGAVRLELNRNLALNDWLISPAIICEKGKLYTLTFDYKVQSKASPERFEVAIGNANTAEAMTEILMEPTVVANQTYITHTVRFIAKADGPVYVGFHGISDADSYALYINNVALSAGASTAIPKAIADLRLIPAAPAENAVEVAFTAPSQTYVGDPLASISSIEITRNGEAVKKFENPTPGAPLSFTDKVPGGGEYEYAVKSFNAAGESPEVSASDYIGSLLTPFAPDFAKDGVTGWTIVDGNNDGKIWTVNKSAIRMQYNTYEDMDDWLITPPIKMQADCGYKLTFQARCHKVTHPEKLIVAYGAENSVEGMTTLLLDTIYVTANTFGDYEAIIAPKTTGTYCVGFHGVSPKGMFYLYLNDIRIAEGVSTVAPGAPTALTVIPGNNAELVAKVDFKTPSVTLNGTPLADLTEVKVLRNAEVIKTFEAPSPGESISFTDTVPVSGKYTYSVIGYNTVGEGLPAEAETYIGYFPPNAPDFASLEITPNMGEVKVTWGDVHADDNGSLIPKDKITYTLYNGKQTVAEGLTGNSHTYQAVEAGKQEFAQVAVYAVVDGVNGHPAYTEMLPVGSPYKDYAESFADGHLKYILGSSPIVGGAVKLANDESLPNFSAMDGDNGYLYVLGQTADSGADFFTGLISLEGLENPALVFYTYNITGEASVVDDNPIVVSVRPAGTKEYVEVFNSKVDEICGSKYNSWGRVHVPLKQFAGQMVQIQFTVKSKTYSFTMFDKMSVESIPAKDIEARSIIAPDKVKSGADYEIDVRLANMGAETADAYKVALYADGKLVDTRECPALEAGSFASVTFPCVMSPLVEAPVEYYAEVSFDGDKNEDNNRTASVKVAPVVNSYPAPTALAAADRGTSVALTWETPAGISRAPQSVHTEDFESGDAFADKFGNWTFIDEDQSPIGGFQSINLPGIDRGESLGSFWVWDAEWSDRVAGNKAEGYRAHSGYKYLFSLFRADDGQVSDYAISPELPGTAQTVSFFAHSYSPSYPEKIEVLYSKGGLSLSDFEGNVALGETTVPGSWTEFHAELPEGAKYFAIHSFATGSFMLMIDDVSFIPAESQGLDLKLKGYNVYRDGKKINSEPVEGCEYGDVDVEIGSDYRYAVTAVYEQGESKGSNEVSVKVSSVNTVGTDPAVVTAVDGAIIIRNAEGLGVKVATPAGAVIYAGKGTDSMRIPASTGIYIVQAGSNTVKVIVR